MKIIKTKPPTDEEAYEEFLNQALSRYEKHIVDTNCVKFSNNFSKSIFESTELEMGGLLDEFRKIKSPKQTENEFEDSCLELLSIEFGRLSGKEMPNPPNIVKKEFGRILKNVSTVISDLKRLDAVAFRSIETSMLQFEFELEKENSPKPSASLLEFQQLRQVSCDDPLAAIFVLEAALDFSISAYTGLNNPLKQKRFTDRAIGIWHQAGGNVAKGLGNCFQFVQKMFETINCPQFNARDTFNKSAALFIKYNK
jgi:hypothetical protein